MTHLHSLDVSWVESNVGETVRVTCGQIDQVYQVYPVGDQFSLEPNAWCLQVTDHETKIYTD